MPVSTDKRPSVSPDALIERLRDAYIRFLDTGSLLGLPLLLKAAADALAAASTDTAALQRLGYERIADLIYQGERGGPLEQALASALGRVSRDLVRFLAAASTDTAARPGGLIVEDRLRAQRDEARAALQRVREWMRENACCGAPSMCGVSCMDSAESHERAVVVAELTAALDTTKGDR